MSILNEIKSKMIKHPAFASRIKHLTDKGIDASIIKDGVTKVANNIKNNVKSMVVYGEPQSGKTEFMIALVCKLLDLGKKTIFVIMNDNTQLEIQNFQRFKSAFQINPSPMRSEEFIQKSDEDKKSDLQRVIFCRKNPTNLSKLIAGAKFLKDRIVLDDEADYASPDTKINKNEMPSKINDLVSQLGDLPPKGEGIYIGVTATPGRLDLNGTFANDSKKWVFLKSHSQYKGREFFFPQTTKQAKKSDYILNTFSSEEDEAKHLEKAFLRFLVRNAVLNLTSEDASATNCYSMLIHTEGQTKSHEEDKQKIEEYISIIQNNKEPKINEYLGYMQEIAEREISKNNLSLDVKAILIFIVKNIGRKSVLTINYKNNDNQTNVNAACSPNDIFTFAIGGNIVSRGLTFENLLTFFFSRKVKHKFQQNTYIQRARMFGNRPYSKYFELCIPEDLFGNWADCFLDHELSLQSAVAGDYVHISSNKTSPADSASIKKATTINFNNEWSVGSVFLMPEKIESMFANNADKKPINFIQKLISDGILPKESFSKSMLETIKSMAIPDQSDIAIALNPQGEFYHPKGDRYFNKYTLTRSKGGLVAQLTKNRPAYKGKSIIMPVKNGEGSMRFYFKNNKGKNVMKNISDQS